MAAARCGYVKMGRGDKLLLCVEKRKHGYTGWLYSKGVKAKRLPVSTGSSKGKAKSISEAFANAKRFATKNR